MIDEITFYVESFPTIIIDMPFCDIFLFESPNPSLATIEVEGDIEKINVNACSHEFGVQLIGWVAPYPSELKVSPFTGSVVVEGDNVEVDARDELSIHQNNGSNLRIYSTLRKLLVNGQEVDVSISSEEPLNRTSIKIFTPPADLNARIYGAVNVTSQAKLRHVDVKLRPLEHLAAIKAQRQKERFKPFDRLRYKQSTW